MGSIRSISSSKVKPKMAGGRRDITSIITSFVFTNYAKITLLVWQYIPFLLKHGSIFHIWIPQTSAVKLYDTFLEMKEAKPGDELTSSWFLGTGFSPGLSPGLAPTACRTPDSSRPPRRRRGPAASAPTCPCRTAASSRRAPTAGSQDGSAGGGCSGCCRAWRSERGRTRTVGNFFTFTFWLSLLSNN